MNIICVVEEKNVLALYEEIWDLPGVGYINARRRLAYSKTFSGFVFSCATLERRNS